MTNKPCKRCGKAPRNDYGGICMDCADALGISEIFKHHPMYAVDLKAAVEKYHLKLKTT